MYTGPGMGNAVVPTEVGTLQYFVLPADAQPVGASAPSRGLALQRSPRRRAPSSPSTSRLAFPPQQSYTWQTRVNALERAQREQEESECTFAPAINPRSRRMASSRARHGWVGVHARTRAWEIGRAVDRDRLRREQEARDLAECSFRPARPRGRAAMTWATAARMSYAGGRCRK